MENLTRTDLHAVAAIMDDLESRSHDPDDKVRAAIEKYREDYGSLEFRDRIVDFAINTELFLNSLSDDGREDAYNAYTWDFEWLPEVMNRLNAKGLVWWAAPVSRIAKIHSEMMEKVTFKINK